MSNDQSSGVLPKFRQDPQTDFLLGPHESISMILKLSSLDTLLCITINGGTLYGVSKLAPN